MVKAYAVGVDGPEVSDVRRVEGVDPPVVRFPYVPRRRDVLVQHDQDTLAGGLLAGRDANRIQEVGRTVADVASPPPVVPGPDQATPLTYSGTARRTPCVITMPARSASFAKASLIRFARRSQWSGVIFDEPIALNSSTSTLA